MSLCIVCANEVRRLQHAFQCDGCEMWQHRTCNTGIDHVQYRKMMKQQRDGQNVSWFCARCADRNSADLVINSTTNEVEAPSFQPDVSDIPVLDDSRTLTIQPVIYDDPPLLYSCLEIPNPAFHFDHEATMVDMIEMTRHSQNLTAEYDVEVEENEQTISPTDPSMIDEPMMYDYTIPSDSEEDSLIEETPCVDSDSEPENEWEVIEKGTEKGKPKLVNRNGYSYVINKTRKETRYWACSVKNKNVKCLSAVTEKNGVFTTSLIPHCHPPVAGAKTMTKLKAAFKDKAQTDKYASTPQIVDEALDTHLKPSEPCELPHPKSLYRTANRVRQATRPNHPDELKFELNLDAIPTDFVQADISVHGKRHFLLATSFMLSLLLSAKNWFVDGTFKVVRSPFVQLFSIHAFIRQGHNLKQIPLAFFLMSGKSSNDYESIFKALLKVIGRRNLSVKTITLDFEAATWTALRKVFPSVSLRGCLFHWNQAIWRYIQNLGLVNSYLKKDSAYKFCRRVMALPFLPAENIYPMFCALKSSVPAGPYEQLMCYIDQTWMKSSVWPIDSWCVFKRTIRTNNDCEGWHRRLNGMVPGQAGLNFYFLIQILFRETRDINRQVKFVSEGKLLRYHRDKFLRHHGIIVKAWEDFESGAISQKELLRICGRLNGPVV